MIEQSEIRLKKIFNRYNKPLLNKTARYCCWVSMLGMLSAVLLEYCFYPQFLYDFFIVRLGCVAFTGIILLLTYFKFGDNHISLLHILTAVIPCLAMNIMIYMSEGSTSPYYVGLILIIVMASSVMPWLIRDVLVVIGVIIVCYILACLLHTKTPLNIKIFLGNLYFLLFVAGLSISANYINAKIRFKEFKAKHKIQALLEEKEETELKLIRSERLNAIGTLAAGIIHEINNPLTVILGHAEYIRDNETKPNILDSAVKIIDFGVEPIEKITGNLKDFCGNIGEVEPVLLSEIIDFARNLAKSKLRGLNVNINISEDDNVLVRKNDIILVFTNLFVNASYALKKAERDSIDIKAFKSDNFFVVTFKDNGIGIDKENLIKIFDPFFTTKQKDGGLGLGLSTCHKIIENHGGRLNVESKKGEWTEFIFNLSCIKE